MPFHNSESHFRNGDFPHLLSIKSCKWVIFNYFTRWWSRPLNLNVFQGIFYIVKVNFERGEYCVVKLTLMNNVMVTTRMVSVHGYFFVILGVCQLWVVSTFRMSTSLCVKFSYVRFPPCQLLLCQVVIVSTSLCVKFSYVNFSPCQLLLCQVVIMSTSPLQPQHQALFQKTKTHMH